MEAGRSRSPFKPSVPAPSPPWERTNAAPVPYLSKNSPPLTQTELEAMPALWATTAISRQAAPDLHHHHRQQQAELRSAAQRPPPHGRNSSAPPAIYTPHYHHLRTPEHSPPLTAPLAGLPHAPNGSLDIPLDPKSAPRHLPSHQTYHHHTVHPPPSPPESFQMSRSSSNHSGQYEPFAPYETPGPYEVPRRKGSYGVAGVAGVSGVSGGSSVTAMPGTMAAREGSVGGAPSASGQAQSQSPPQPQYYQQQQQQQHRPSQSRSHSESGHRQPSESQIPSQSQSQSQPHRKPIPRPFKEFRDDRDDKEAGYPGPATGPADSKALKSPGLGKRFKLSLKNLFKREPVDEESFERIEDRHWADDE